MNEIFTLEFELPPILPFNPKRFPSSFVYVGVAGFEPRSLGILDRLLESGVNIDSTIGITYLPFDSRNKETEFKEKISRVASETTWIVFDRHDPQKFQDTFPSVVDALPKKAIVVDISGMSKFLIMIVLQSLRSFDGEVIIAYIEAEDYHPTPEEFEKAKKHIKGSEDFLTSDVFRILHVTALSSSAMQGHPILLIAYPTFNHNEIVALHNELSPNCMVTILGKPHEKKNEWRLNALREINSKILEDRDYCQEPVVMSTFNYVSNVWGLEDIYQKYKYTHRLLLSPTGSKLQTVSAFLFKQMRPDVQIVYPSTKSFIGEYTEGCTAFWYLRFENFLSFISAMDRFRRLN